MRERRWWMGVVMVVAAVVMTKGERMVECEEEEVHEMQDNFVNCTHHFKQEYNVQVLKQPQVVELLVFASCSQIDDDYFNGKAQ